MTHGNPTQATDPGVEHEEHHDLDHRTQSDPRLHDGPRAIASDLEANATRPAGPNVRAEDVAARRYDPEMPLPQSENDRGPG